jgi:outer membrane protein assembly factor BamB
MAKPRGGGGTEPRTSAGPQPPARRPHPAVLWIAIGAIVAGSSIVVVSRELRVVGSTPLLRVAPSVSPPARTVLAEVGQGFRPGERVDLYLDSTNVDDVIAPSAGLVRTGIGIPTSAVPGTHWLTAVGSVSRRVAQTPLVVRTDWAEDGFSAAHDGFNISENLIGALNVYSLRAAWSAPVGGSVEGTPAVIAGRAFAASTQGGLEAFSASGCGATHCQPEWSGRSSAKLFGPAVAAGRVFVTTSDGHLLVFPASGCGEPTCQPQWSAVVGSGSTTAPTVSGEFVYAGSTDGSVAAFSVAGCGAPECRPAWTSSVGGAVAGPPTLGFVTRPRRRVLFIGTDAGSLVALDASTGAALWSADTRGPVTGSVAFTSDVIKDKTVVYVTSSLGVISAMDAATGRPIWWDSPASGSPMSPPTVVTSRVFVGSATGRLYAYQAEGCGLHPPSCDPIWVGGVSGDPPITNQPTAGGGVVYVTHRGGSVEAFDLPGWKGSSCPTPLWSSGDAFRGASSAAISNGSVYVGTQDGALQVLRLPGGQEPPAKPSADRLTPFSWPIRHVVVIFQENHSFDNVLGYACWHWSHPDVRGPEPVPPRPGLGMACDGAISGKASGVTGRLPLRKSPDVVPNVDHGTRAHTASVAGGLMNGFDTIFGCTASAGYGCYTQYYPSQVPNLARLASDFVISDRTFETRGTATWGSHTDLASAKLGGFTGDIPFQRRGTPSGPGWGCDSLKIAQFIVNGARTPVPACYPRVNGSGPFGPSPARYQKTIMDRYDAAGLSWRVYESRALWSNGDVWSMCPTFAECLYGPQAGDVRPADTLLSDARAGTLPNIAYSLPFPGHGRKQGTSQHNGTSMATGDNQIGRSLKALMTGPEWRSTVVFITYDDCGCFYDHVPARGGGIRVPMVIVSPFVKRGFTDHNDAVIASILSFTEHLFHLNPLAKKDSEGYDYIKSFNFKQISLAPVAMTRTEIPLRERRYLLRHPESADDPT